MFKRSHSELAQRVGTSKIVTGFVVLATTAVIGTTGIVGATPAGKPTKAQCSAAGYSNYGQCVKEWAKNKSGNGYGGNGGVQNNNSVTVKIGDIIDSTVNVVINIFN